jgi:hypothetical protein
MSHKAVANLMEKFIMIITHVITHVDTFYVLIKRLKSKRLFYLLVHELRRAMVRNLVKMSLNCFLE